MDSRFHGYKTFEYSSFITAVRCDFRDNSFHPSSCCIGIDSSFRHDAFAYGTSPKTIRCNLGMHAFYKANDAFAFHCAFKDYAFSQSEKPLAYKCRFTAGAFHRARRPLAIDCRFDGVAFEDADDAICVTTSALIGNPRSGIFLFYDNPDQHTHEPMPYFKVFSQSCKPEETKVTVQDIREEWTINNAVPRLKSLVRDYKLRLPPSLEHSLYERD